MANETVLLTWDQIKTGDEDETRRAFLSSNVIVEFIRNTQDCVLFRRNFFGDRLELKVSVLFCPATDSRGRCGFSANRKSVG